jgi:hypothetical protein
MMMMKKLLLFAVLAIGFASCEKDKINKHCYRCEWVESYQDDKGTYTSYTDSSIQCDMTEEQIKIYEDRYKGRILLDTTYTDTKCFQKPDPE